MTFNQTIRTFILATILWMYFPALAQDPCGSPAYIDYLEAQFSGAKQAVTRTYMDAISEGQAKSKFEIDTVYKIQVVFHIVYNSQIENVSDDYVYSQLKILNDCFRRTSADTSETRRIFRDVAGDARIEFELAQVDPIGNPSSGIVRKQTVISSFGGGDYDLRDRVKSEPYGSAAWDTEKYLNIWVCDLSRGGVDGLLGYAYPPVNSEFWQATNYGNITREKQGVVLHYKVLGGSFNGGVENFTEGKSLVHEVGHYLGLRHIWGDGGCYVDDFLDDTPLSARANLGCMTGINTCGFQLNGDLPDMIENYMDYSNDACKNMFSKQQVAHMRYNLRELRSGIYEEQITVPPKPAFVDGRVGVYPNPALDELNVYMENPSLDKMYRIEFYNLLGQSIGQFSLNAYYFQTVSGLSALKGTYAYRIYEDDSEMIRGKILFGY